VKYLYDFFLDPINFFAILDPPEKPNFQFVPKNELAKEGKILKNELTVKERSSFTVICRFHGDPAPTCTWNKGNDVTSSNLTFTNITKENNGYYECTAENGIQSAPKHYTNTSTSKAGLQIDVLCKSFFFSHK
jgi:hypothetical protein